MTPAELAREWAKWPDDHQSQPEAVILARALIEAHATLEAMRNDLQHFIVDAEPAWTEVIAALITWHNAEHTGADYNCRAGDCSCPVRRAERDLRALIDKVIPP